MSDPVQLLLLMLFFVVAAAGARYFRTLDGSFWSAATTPLLAGVASGILFRLFDLPARWNAALVGFTLTLAALYVRLTGEESEAVDGMLLGSLSGAAAAVPLFVGDDRAFIPFSQCVLAGAVAGFGITFAAFHVADKLRQLLLDVVTAALAVGAAWLPLVLSRGGVPELHLAAGTAALVPLLVILSVFRQWPDLRAELRHEASLGFLEDSDVRATAHPLLRLGRGGWVDGHAHREFVRVANRIALRKRQQRNRPEEMARLYQLEIIKLRMQLQEMTRINRAAASATALRGSRRPTVG